MTIEELAALIDNAKPSPWPRRFDMDTYGDPAEFAGPARFYADEEGCGKADADLVAVLVQLAPTILDILEHSTCEPECFRCESLFCELADIKLK